MVVEMRQVRAVLRMRGPLRSRNFRLLVACDVVSGIGSAVAFVAIPSGLRKKYGNQVVLDGIDLSIGEGEVFALLGLNGAGMT